jgi:hypothetical protein
MTSGLAREKLARRPAAKWLTLGALSVFASCAPSYAYTFHLENRDVRASSKPDGQEGLEDADLRVEILVDPTAARAIYLTLTNKTDQVLQVEWTNITMSGPGKGEVTLRPEMDLGWVLPGATVHTRLVPFALPPSGNQAAEYQGRRFELVLPVIVRREPRAYHYAFVATVEKL